MMYLQDWHENSVPIFLCQPPPPAANSVLYTWMNLLRPELKSDNVLNCPSAAPWNRYGYMQGMSAWVSYAIFSDLTIWDPSGNGICRGISFTKLIHPTKCAFIADSGVIPANDPNFKTTTSMGYYVMNWDAWGGDNGMPPEPRHNGGANFILCDGHVKWLPKSKIGDYSGRQRPFSWLAPNGIDPDLWTTTVDQKSRH